ncbi:negative acting factor [Pyrenophora seminiperda CCB06]|uniref:Negative acting factor n=1 Tax=Pyrenophora seminiperda CCB06 TaxID=1302712 RepID=A0A3M7LVJ2_9PLEO|nr:negative acting factor [Pyrenophora seminiperda CCB06]
MRRRCQLPQQLHALYFRTTDQYATSFIMTTAVLAEPIRDGGSQATHAPHVIKLMDAWSILDWLLNSALGSSDGKVCERLFDKAQRSKPLDDVTFNPGLDEKAGHECKYRDQADILFRNQTASAAQRAEESWRKRSKSHQRASASETMSVVVKTPPSDECTPPALADDQHSPAGSANSPSGSTDGQAHHAAAPTIMSIIDLSRMSITPAANPDFRRKAFERFVYDFVLPDSPDRNPNEPTDALWMFIPLLYEKAPQDSLIATTVDAVSYVNYANRCHDKRAAVLAGECLGKAIPMLTKVIAEKKDAATDETLCSVYLMGVYENFASGQRKGTYIAHHNGANALLQLRSVEQYQSHPISAKIYEVTYSQMLLGNLQSAKRPPIPTRDVAKVDSYLPSLYNNANVFVMRLIWKVTMLHAKWHEVKQSATPPTSRLALQELLQNALELDVEFRGWESSITPAWRYEMAPNTPQVRSTYSAKWQKLFLACRGAPPEIHSYPSMKRCWIWGFYRTSRIFLLRDTLELLNWMLRFREPNVPSYLPMGPPPPATAQAHSVSAALSNRNLCLLHSVTTSHLVHVIEKSCSALIGSFTVPIHLKSFDDVCGMRGYICLWPLGIMDAVLKTGLVPDTNAAGSPPMDTTTSHAYLYQQQQMSPTNPDDPSQHSTNPPNHDSYATAPPFSEPSTIRPKLETPPSSNSGDQHVPSSSAGSSPASTTSIPLYDHTAKKGHIFDSNPAHPYDHAFDLPLRAYGIAEPRRLDVGGCREWINRLLYYIAADLGIKKALYIPLTEGFLQSVEPAVERVLGRG